MKETLNYRYTIMGYVTTEGDTHRRVKFPEEKPVDDLKAFAAKRSKGGRRIVDLRHIKDLRSVYVRQFGEQRTVEGTVQWYERPDGVRIDCSVKHIRDMFMQWSAQESSTAEMDDSGAVIYSVNDKPILLEL